LRTFASPSCTIRNTSICSSGASRTRWSISTSTSSAPSAIRKLDVAAEGRVERRAPAGRRQREHCEARFLLRRDSELLDPRDRLLRRLAVLEHARVRREREEILGEAVVDLTRDPCALLGDRAAELRRRDRAPHPDEQHAERDHAQEVSDRHRGARKERREDAVERGEEAQRRGRRQPAVEVVSAVAIAQPEAEQREEREQRQERKAHREQQRRVRLRRARRERRKVGPERAKAEPEPREHGEQHADRVPERALPRDDGPAHPRRERDQPGREERTEDRGPALDARRHRRVEHGNDLEHERRARSDEEARRENEVEASSFDREPDAGEHRDDAAGERDRRVEHESERRRLPRMAERGVVDEQRQRGSEEPEQEQLAGEPVLVGIAFLAAHVPLIGRPPPADEP
jgi:hypothetical protein